MAHGVRSLGDLARGLNQTPWFGLPHPCAHCGLEVQWVERRGAKRCEELATGVLHDCAAPVELGDLIGCDCGRPVVRYGGLDGRRCERDGSPHRCPVQDQEAIAPPIRIVARESRAPRGTVILP